MTTAQEAAEKIGKRGLLQVDGGLLWVEVEIVGARQDGGHLDSLEYKVKPVAGEGEAWHYAYNILTQYVLKKGIQK